MIYRDILERVLLSLDILTLSPGVLAHLADAQPEQKDTHTP